MGVGPISWVVMSDYCIVNDITGEMREDFIYLVNALDATYLNYINDKSKKSKAGK